MDRNEISNDGFLVWPSDLALAPLRELVSHVRRTLLTLTHNAGVKLGAVPSTDSDFENGGSTSKLQCAMCNKQCAISIISLLHLADVCANICPACGIISIRQCAMCNIQ